RPAWAPFQLGGIGSLFFVYVCVRLINTVERRSRVLIEIGRILLESSIIVAIFAAVVRDVDRTVYAAAFALALAFNLFIRITTRLRGLHIKSGPGMSFFRWLLFANATSLDDFVDSMDSIPWATKPLVLRG